MRVIIAGTRTITDISDVEEAIKEAEFKITEVVSGCARGVDQLGEAWAKKNNIPVMQFPADWKSHGRLAGPIRNSKMAKYADALIAIWDWKSKGTKNMIMQAEEAKLQVYIFHA